MHLEVKVITLKSTPPPIVETLRSVLGADVAVVPGMDVRSADADNLVRAGILGNAGYASLRRGRKQHHELPGKGGIGCYLAHMRAIETTDVHRSLLVVEDDCVIKDTRLFLEDLERLLQQQDEFDVAVYGALRDGGAGGAGGADGAGGGPRWSRLAKDESFILMQCVLYTPAARVLLPTLAYPVDMQIDAMWSILQQRGQLRILASCDNVVQAWHVSSIQEAIGTCLWCDPWRTVAVMWTAVTALTAVAVVTVAAARSGKIRRRVR